MAAVAGDPGRGHAAVSRRPHGPLAPPTRRARLRSRYGGTNAGRLARKARNAARLTYSKFQSGQASLLPAAGIVQGRSEPVKTVCDRRTTAPVKSPGERTCEDGLDRTCPDQAFAAIGSRDSSGHTV